MKVIDTLRGYVEKVTETTAYLTLCTEGGSEFFGEMSIGEMKRHGLREEQAFILRTVEINEDTVKFVWEPIEPRGLTQEENDEITKRIKLLLEDWPDEEIVE